MSFQLPHKANIGEIIKVKGYNILFLVVEWMEERNHGKNGIEENVTYTCQNIDNYKDVKIIFDQDIDKVVVTADKADEFIKARLKGAKPPAVSQEPKGIDLAEFVRQFNEAKAQREKAQPKPKKPFLSEHERKRKEYREKQEYIDYLLDTYSMLEDLETLIGPDEVRQEEIRLLKEEFHAKSAELYGANKK